MALIVSELAMLMIYFGLFLPTGLLLRLAGRDALKRQLDRNTTTYWTIKKKPSSAVSYYRQS